MEGCNILCWNVRGLNKRNKQRSLLDFFRLNKIGLGAFLETKLRGNKIEEMMKTIFVGWDCFSDPTVEGRILLVWKFGNATINVLQVEEQLIHCSVNIVGVPREFCLTFSYGRNSIEERKCLWQALSLLVFLVHPLLVAGDFNAVFDYDDRIGGQPVTDLEMEDARCWRACNMVDELRMIALIDAFPNSEARFNWDVISDHCYCVIKTMLVKVSGVKPFKFFNMWADHVECGSTVISNWSEPVHDTGLLGILKKMHRLKFILHKFNKMKFGDVVHLFSTAKEKYQQAQFDLQQDPSSLDLQHAEKDACLGFSLHSRIYESFLRQRSKITWLRCRDENTSYFPTSLKQRKVGNRITSFMDDKGFMGSPSSATTQLQQDCFTHGATLNIDQQLGLIKPFTKKDVKESLFSIHSLKSPGPDGTIISLIPKVDSPSKAADYRPIACCNTLYKCISKMLCVRLARVLPVLVSSKSRSINLVPLFSA
ncbi:uncharacterized protein LOC133799958 [Humulus lupulus]|uniref:uncharacterized protein LOC133799958 n=1 Tax=Humulus lupulus TaxID=3486 RepID=UPI002B413347|nr:uncharacterized protein LOC133799958 [Humulus lupulus]